MKHLTLFWAFLLSMSLAAQRSGKDYAVFFYVTDFKSGWAKLPETATEANQLKTELETNFGFTCEAVPNPSKTQILAKLKAYNDRLTAEDQVLFFFSMHGHYEESSERGFLIAADGAFQDEYGESWLSYDDLSGFLARCKAKHLLLALDACHSGAFGIRNKARPDAPTFAQSEDCAQRVARMLRYTGRQYCSSGNKASKTPAKSLFASRFLEALRKGGENGIIRFDDLEYYLGKVENPKPESGTFKGHEPGGDFVFVRKNACPQLLASKNGDPADRDADGVPDASDTCPETWASTSNGCPDADEDGVSDKDDNCPYEKGLPANKGCPAAPKVVDRDGDGVPDVGDQCPDSKGIAKYQGCPDSDGDGVPDNKDQCPNEKGVPANNGCPQENASITHSNETDKKELDASVQSGQGDATSLKSWGLKYWSTTRSKAQAYEKAMLDGNIRTPVPSPFCEMNKQIGTTNIRIAYSSPGLKGRTYLGDIVPYGEKWRTGANASTKISFSQQVTVAGSILPAGTYALYSMPGEREWTFYFYGDTTQWGIPTPNDWKEDQVIAKATVAVEKLSKPIENMLFVIDEVTPSTFKVCLLVSDVKLAIPFTILNVAPDTKRYTSGFYQEVALGGLSLVSQSGKPSAGNDTGYWFLDKNAQVNGVDLPGGAYFFQLSNDQIWLTSIDTVTWVKRTSIPAYKIRLTGVASGLKLKDDYVCPVYLMNSFGVFQVKIGSQFYEFQLNYNTDGLVMANIQMVLSRSEVKPNDYYIASRYYYEEKKDMRQALEWVNKSLEKGGDKFWILRQKANILAELGLYKDAITTANKSTELAKAEGNADYPRMNEKSIQEWSKKK